MGKDLRRSEALGGARRRSEALGGARRRSEIFGGLQVGVALGGARRRSEALGGARIFFCPQSVGTIVVFPGTSEDAMLLCVITFTPPVRSLILSP